MTYRRHRRRRLAGQSGFTLVELLVAMTMALVVFGAVLSLVLVALHQQMSTSNRADALDTAQVAVAQITKDLRQACAGTVSIPSNATSGTKVTFNIGQAPNGCTSNTTAIAWDCGVSGTGGTSCVRTVAGSNRTYATLVISSPVFTCQNPPGTTAACATATYVQIQLALAVTCAGEGRTPTGCPSSRKVQVTDGVNLRNA